MRSMPETSRRDSEAPFVTDLRILASRVEGFDVELRLGDGRVKRAWIPRSIVHDARIRLRMNEDLVAALDRPSLGEAGMHAIALLCAYPEGQDDTLVRVGWAAVPPEAQGPEHDLTELPTERVQDGLDARGTLSGAGPRPQAVEDEPPWMGTVRVLAPAMVVGIALMGAGSLATAWWLMQSLMAAAP